MRGIARSRRFAAVAFAALLAAFSGTAQAQSEKPDAAVTPVAAIGEISDAKRGIIFNRLQTVLSRYFKLVSQAEYAAAEEAAFEQLEAEECTEEQCIRAIQDILQVETLFVLQIIREGDFTQLTLNMVRESDKVVLDDTCEGCTISELHAKVEALVVQMVAGEPAAPPPVAAAPPKPEMVTVDRSGWALWTAGGLLLAGAVTGLDAQTQADDANSKANAARDDDDATEYEAAQSDIDDAKSSADLANILFVIGVGVAIYYLNSGDQVPATTFAGGGYPATAYRPLILRATPNTIHLGWRLRW